MRELVVAHLTSNGGRILYPLPSRPGWLFIRCYVSYCCTSIILGCMVIRVWFDVIFSCFVSPTLQSSSIFDRFSLSSQYRCSCIRVDVSVVRMHWYCTGTYDRSSIWWADILGNESVQQRCIIQAYKYTSTHVQVQTDWTYYFRWK